MQRTRLCAAVAAMLAAAVSARGAEADQLPTRFTNLQVLPKDIQQRPLIDLMRGFTQALDVRCEHCHVGEGNDLSAFDFAADTKAAKVTARRMLRMLSAINDEWLPGVGEPPPAGARKVSCFTCHRGALTPAVAPARAGGPGRPTQR